MPGISKQAKEYFAKINTKHTRHMLQSGKVIDLSKEDNATSDLRRLGEQSPNIFVPKAQTSKTADKGG